MNEDRVNRLERKLEGIHHSVHENRMCIKDNEKEIALLQAQIKNLINDILEFSTTQKETIIELKNYKQLVADRREEIYKMTLKKSWGIIVAIGLLIVGLFKYVLTKHFDITMK